MKGAISLESLEAPSLAGNPLGDPTKRSVLIYTPPGYAGGTERYPSVYFLHGYAGSVHGWLNTSAFSPGVPERLDALIDRGQLPPLVGVFVDGWTAVGGSQWIDSAAIGAYGSYLTRDVVGWVDARYRTRATPQSRALVGKSSGGYGALATAAHRPGVFGHIASHAGDAYFEYCYLGDFPKTAAALLAAGGVEAWWRGLLQRGRETHLRGDDHPVMNTLAMAAAYSPAKDQPMGFALPFEPHTARLRPEVWEKWLANDPVRFIPQRLDAFRSLGTVFVDCGTRDEFHLRWGARMVAESLRSGGVAVLHEEFEDGHGGINYRYDASLRAIGPRLG